MKLLLAFAVLMFNVCYSATIRLSNNSSADAVAKIYNSREVLEGVLSLSAGATENWIKLDNPFEKGSGYSNTPYRVVWFMKVKSHHPSHKKALLKEISTWDHVSSGATVTALKYSLGSLERKGEGER